MFLNKNKRVITSSKHDRFEIKTGVIKSPVTRIAVYCSRILIFFVIVCNTVDAQIMISEDSISPIRIISINPRIYKTHDTIYVYSGICKTLKTTRLTGQDALYHGRQNLKDGTSLFTIHGNIQYDFLYRSFSDTPFFQKDFRQHTIQTSLTAVVKNKYPVRINMVVRKSNSPFFRDFFDAGLSFDKFSYDKITRQQLLAKIVKQIPGQSYLDAANKLLEREIKNYNLLKNRLSTNGLAQQLIEEREKIFFRTLQQSNTGSINTNDLADELLNGELVTQVNEKKDELDSLQNNIEKLRYKVDSLKNKIAREISVAKQKINNSNRLKELASVSDEYAVKEEKDKGEKIIAGLRNIGLGRTILNYSELTARDVSLTGLNVEYNPRMYAAFAAGRIDYGFRDFFGRNNRSFNQHLIIGRIGVGNIEKRAVIFSLFTGKKASYGGVLSDTAEDNILVTGYSIETIIKKDNYTQFSAEIAKSTQPVTGRYGDNKALGNLFQFHDNTNLGVSIKGQTIIRETQTELSGFFRKTGENFQSFSLFSYNTDQTAWMMKAEQSFLKDRINFSGTLRRNDFVNSFTEKTYKTSTIFGSVQLAVRVPKWPSVSIGYHPGSQLYIVDRNRIRENVYYILNGAIVHQYKLFNLQMVSSAIYNNYTTKGTDSGFINYSGSNYILSQSISFRKLHLQGNFIYTDQQELQYYTIENSLDYSITTMLRLGAGVKYNKVLNGNTYMGAAGQLICDIKKLGSLQLQYEKSFLPTIQRTLFPVEIGRLTLVKNL